MMTVHQLLYVFFICLTIWISKGSTSTENFNVTVYNLYEDFYFGKFDFILRTGEVLLDYKPYKNSIEKCENIYVKHKMICYIGYEQFIQKRVNNLFNVFISVNEISTNNSNNITSLMSISVENIWEDKLKCNCDGNHFNLHLINKNLKDILKEKGWVTPNHDFPIYIVLKAQNNQKSFLTVPYFNEMFFVHGCPSDNYKQTMLDAKYIVDEHVKKNGVLNFGSTENFWLLPIIPKVFNEKFFVCGTLKQPSLPDIIVGYQLINDMGKVKSLSVNKYPVASNKACDNANISIYLSFLYSYNINQVETLMPFQKMKRNIQKNYISNIYTFDVSSFSGDEISYNFADITPVRPSCIETFKNQNSNFQSLLMYNTLLSENFHNLSHLIINENFYNRYHRMFCPIKFNDYENITSYDYYSQPVKDSIYRDHHLYNNISYPIKRLYTSKKQFETFGKYFCYTNDEYNVIQKNKKKEKIYFYLLPKNNETFELLSKKIENLYQLFYEYGDYILSFSSLENIKVFDGEKLIYSVTNFSLNNHEKLFDYSMYPQITIKRKYKTIINTTFYTEQQFNISLVIKNLKKSTLMSSIETTVPKINIETTTNVATEVTKKVTTEATTKATTEATTIATTEATTIATTEATTIATTEATTKATTEATTIATTTASTKVTTEATTISTTKATTKKVEIEIMTTTTTVKPTTKKLEKVIMITTSTIPSKIIGPPKEEPTIIRQKIKDETKSNSFVWISVSVFFLFFIILLVIIIYLVIKEKLKYNSNNGSKSLED